ncbi:MAG TPA: hypothetical protein DDW52_02500 [Planctomycetaceae bacterium]|nr:hypothetical protein [Planctomycetaceae bacterium]
MLPSNRFLVSRPCIYLWAVALLATFGVTQCDGACPNQGVEIRLSASEFLEGEAIELEITGLDAGQSVAIRASRFSSRRNSVFSSTALYRSNADGQIRPFLDEPVVAAWRERDPAGMFWSMEPNSDVSTEPFADKKWRDIRLQFDWDVDGSWDAERWLELVLSNKPLRERKLGEEFPGSFLLRDTSNEPLPVVIALGGSEGGDSAARSIAPKLAARGFACVGVPYYSPAWGNQPQQFPGLPKAFANIPLDTIEKIVAWIETQDDLDPNRIALYGVSKGAEMALAAASRIDRFAAVAAIVPSDVIWEGWGAQETTSSFSWRGKPLPFVPYLGMGEEFAKSGRNQAVRIRLPHDAGRLANPERIQAASIDVAAIKCPVFVVGGDEDNTWDSGGMARNIAERRTTAKLKTELIVSQDAGHQLSGTAYTNLSPADAQMRMKAFPALIDFLTQNLK